MFSSDPSHSSIIESIKSLNALKKAGNPVTVVWITAHTDPEMNGDKADTAAGNAAKQKACDPGFYPSLKTAKTNLKNIANRAFVNFWKGHKGSKFSKALIKKIHPNSFLFGRNHTERSIWAKIQSGVAPVNKLLRKFKARNEVQGPYCDRCRSSPESCNPAEDPTFVEEDLTHIILDCPTLQPARNKMVLSSPPFVFVFCLVLISDKKINILPLAPTSQMSTLESLRDHAKFFALPQKDFVEWLLGKPELNTKNPHSHYIKIDAVTEFLLCAFKDK